MVNKIVDITSMPFDTAVEYLNTLPVHEIVQASIENARVETLIENIRLKPLTLNVSVLTERIEFSTEGAADGRLVFEDYSWQQIEKLQSPRGLRDLNPTTGATKWRKTSGKFELGNCLGYIIKKKEEQMVTIASEEILPLVREYLQYVKRLVPNVILHLTFDLACATEDPETDPYQVLPLSMAASVKVRGRSYTRTGELMIVLTSVNSNASVEFEDESASGRVMCPILNKIFIAKSNYCWFSRNQLLHSNFEHLEMNTTMCTGHDIKDFVDQWQQGMFPRVKYISIGIKKKTGFSLENYKRKSRKSPVMFKTSTGKQIMCQNGRDVHRHGGQRATVLIRPLHNSDFCSNTFIFVVWD